MWPFSTWHSHLPCVWAPGCFKCPSVCTRSLALAPAASSVSLPSHRPPAGPGHCLQRLPLSVISCCSARHGSPPALHDPRPCQAAPAPRRSACSAARLGEKASLRFRLPGLWSCYGAAGHSLLHLLPLGLAASDMSSPASGPSAPRTKDSGLPPFRTACVPVSCPLSRLAVPPPSSLDSGQPRLSPPGCPLPTALCSGSCGPGSSSIAILASPEAALTLSF